jgi:aryl-alcohol dehydrogenase-like predicted oxidoreductase
VPDIVAVLSLAGQVLTKQRQEGLEADRRRHEQERIRYVEQQRRQHDINRWQRFLALAQHSKEA